MSLRTFFATPFKSKLSRRMFVVFLFCAILPIALVTLISDLYVKQHLESRISQDLRSTSRVYQTVVYDTLLICENEFSRFWQTWPPDLALDDLDLTDTRANSVGLYFVGLGRTVDGRAGGAGARIHLDPLTDQERQSLDRGQTVIRVTDPTPRGADLLMLTQRDGVLHYGILNMDYLRGRMADYSSWGNVELAVLTQDRQFIAGSMPAGEMPDLKRLDRQRHAGIFDVAYERADLERVGVVTTLFIKGHFGASNWSLMLAKPRDAAFEPLETFRRTLVLMMLIAMVTICLFLVILIRRYTGHIDVLQTATEKIRNRDFDHTIDISSGDEFEQLGEAFNTMTQSLRDYRHELSRQAERLQEKVIEIRAARQKEHVLQEQLARTERLDSLGQLAGGVAHDFNNLLLAIMGNADLAMGELQDASPARANLDAIQSASRRAADLCRQMLVYAGRGSYDFEMIDLSAVIRDVGDLMRVSISREVKLTYDITNDLPPIFGDASQVMQVVLNFITNASAAIGRQSGEITVATGLRHCTDDDLRTTYFESELRGGPYVYLQVSDTGCGMDEKTVARIFDPFFTTKADGYGLGLAAVLGIIRAHQGALTVNSQPGVGSTFTVYFPAQTGTGSGGATNNTASTWKGSGSMLVVDDEEVVREVAGNMLSHLGFSVMSATGGSEAVALVRRDPGAVDAVFLDMRMPHMDGAETLRELRAIRPDIPAILTSANARSNYAELLENTTRVAFLQKPYAITSLSAVLESLFDTMPAPDPSALDGK